jgi:uncharacterized protein
MDEEFREFQVFVKPVGSRCNLHCSYCYYIEQDHRESRSGRFVMDDIVLGEYIRQHLSVSDRQNVFFSWHGGEPTLAGIDFYRRAVEIQKQFAPPGCSIINGIQTNATLLNDDWGRFLKEEGFRVGVSLDGPEQFHNSHRGRSDGKGTFAEVIRGLSILRTYGVPHEILCVVNSVNVSAPLEVYRFFKNLGAENITFLPLVEQTGDIHDGSGAVQPAVAANITTDRSVRPDDFGRFLSVIFDEWLAEDIGRVKVQIFEEALRTAFGQDHTLCIFRKECGAVPVVEMNGDFYCCDHYVNVDHLIGNIMHRSLGSLLDDPRQKTFGEAKRALLPRYCLECDVLEMCNGECPKNRFITTPDGEPYLNYLCEGYRLFFNHCRPFIREVARLWKKDQPFP